MNRFLAPDLALLPPLPLVEPDIEAIRLVRGEELARRLVAEGYGFDVQTLETDPLVIASARAGGFREGMAIARHNDAVRSVMLATSWGAYLDHIGAGQTPAVARLPIVPEPRPLREAPEDWEGDEPFRLRILLAPETLSAAGPEGAYLGYALGTPGVKTAAAWGPDDFGGTRLAPFTPLGEVHVPIVAVAGDGTASPELVAAVRAELRPRDRRPTADFVEAFAALIVPYRIELVYRIARGVDGSAVKREGDRRLALLTASRHRPAGALPLDVIKAAAFVPGTGGALLVEEVSVIAPAAGVNTTPITPTTPEAAYRAPYCTEIVTRVEVIDG